MLREAAGVSEIGLDVPAGATAGDAASHLATRYPAIERYLSRIAYAINQSYAPPDSPLKQGDELALIPPVSGG